MTFQYLTEDNLFDLYDESKRWTQYHVRPFPEFERIVRNEPSPNIPAEYPKTTDGTTASIVRKTPHRIVQQIPTGKVISNKKDWLSVFASYVYTKIIIPNANEQYALFQKCQNIVEKAMTYGSQVTFAPVIKRGEYFGADLTLPYIGDVFFQKGKVSDTDSKYIFLRSWWQPSDIDALIKQVKSLEKSAKSRGEAYESGWDVAALKKIRNAKTSKDNQGTTPNERGKGTQADAGIEIIHAFERGVGKIFFSANPAEEVIVRRKKNKDPRGELPISLMYCDTDGSNPFGRGVVELVGGMQNLIDTEVQMYQFNRALMLAPPLFKKGNYNNTQIKLSPNAVIDGGSDPNASLTPISLDSSAVANFPANYGLQKSQLLNLLSSPDSSISSTIGNPGFSKTDAGVHQIEANVSVDDNYMRKQFETWFERWSETAINLWFAERSGVEEFEVDDETAAKLRDIDPNIVNEENKVRVDFDKAVEALKFEIDASTSNKKDNSQQVEILTGLLERLEGMPNLLQVIGNDKVISLWNSIVMAASVEDPEKIKVDTSNNQPNQPAPMTPEMVQQMIQQALEQLPKDKPKTIAESISWKPGDLTPAERAQALQQGGIQADPEGIAPNTHQMAISAAKGISELQAPQDMQPQAPQSPQSPQPQQPPQLTPEDEQIIQHLQALNVPDQEIGRALAMIKHGYSDQEVMKVLGVA